jgi:hypothetical protein
MEGTLEEREEAYENAMVCWHECYAEAGSSFVFGGGNPFDANLIASESAGRKPTREEFGLPPLKPAQTVAPSIPADDDIPF